MKTSLGIWAFGSMATRFNPGGYKPDLSGALRAAISPICAARSVQ